MSLASTSPSAASGASPPFEGSSSAPRAVRVASLLCWILCGFVLLGLIVKLAKGGIDLQLAWSAVVVFFFGFAAHGLSRGKRGDWRLAVFLACLAVVGGLMGLAALLDLLRAPTDFRGTDSVGLFGLALLIPFALVVTGSALLRLLFLRETREFCNK